MLTEEMIAFRARHNFSQRKAATLANITFMTWSNVERGVQSPSKLTEQKIRMAIMEGDQNESINKQN